MLYTVIRTYANFFRCTLFYTYASLGKYIVDVYIEIYYHMHVKMKAPYILKVRQCNSFPYIYLRNVSIAINFRTFFNNLLKYK